MPSGLNWDVNLSYSYILGHRLRLASGNIIDLIATPLSLSGAGSARHQLNAQWALGRDNFGASGSISWTSGSRIRSLNDDTGAVRYSSLTRIGLEAFVELGRSPNVENPRSFRIKLGIDNLFNRRLRVTGYPGLNDASQRILFDPYGRTIRLTVRKSM